MVELVKRMLDEYPANAMPGRSQNAPTKRKRHMGGRRELGDLGYRCEWVHRDAQPNDVMWRRLALAAALLLGASTVALAGGAERISAVNAY